MGCLEISYKMIKIAKENYFKIFTRDHSRLCQLNVPIFTSIDFNEILVSNKFEETKEIYCSYYNSNADKLSEEIKEKLDKHVDFANVCYEYMEKISKYISRFRMSENRIMKNSFEPSSIENERRKIKHDVQELFEKSNRDLENMISTFHQNHPEDKNGHVGKALQSLHEFLVCVFN